MMKYEFGDKIMYGDMVAVYLHESHHDVDMHYISYRKYEGGTEEEMVDGADIMHINHIADIPYDEIVNLRDEMMFIYGQISAIQFYCDSNAGHALESIGNQFYKILRSLFKDYK